MESPPKNTHTHHRSPSPRPLYDLFLYVCSLSSLHSLLLLFFSWRPSSVIPPNSLHCQLLDSRSGSAFLPETSRNPGPPQLLTPPFGLALQITQTSAVLRSVNIISEASYWCGASFARRGHCRWFCFSLFSCSALPRGNN